MSNIVVHVEDLDSYSLPENVLALIKLLQEKLLKVPEKYRNNTEILFDAYEDYGVAYLKIHMYYSRKRTKTEEQELINEQTKKTNAIVKQELSLLKTLKAKYENN